MSDGRINRYSAAKLAVEGVVVVASILIAFALDAWWAERQLEQEIIEDLGIVEHELAENIRLVKLSVEQMNRVVVASKSLISDLKEQSGSEDVEVVDTMVFWGIFISPTFDPSLGGIDAWIASGRLAGIDSAALRQRLASVRGKVEDVIEEQRVARDISVREIYPLIQHNIGDIDSILQLFAAGLHPRQGEPVQIINSSGTVSVPNSGALRFLLQAKTIWYEAALKEMADFQAELEDIQSLIRAEIGGTDQVIRGSG